MVDLDDVWYSSQGPKQAGDEAGSGAKRPTLAPTMANLYINESTNV